MSFLSRYSYSKAIVIVGQPEYIFVNRLGDPGLLKVKTKPNAVASKIQPINRNSFRDRGYMERSVYPLFLWEINSDNGNRLLFCR